MHKWVVGAMAEPVQLQEESGLESRKRKKAFGIVVTILACTVVAIGWHVATRDTCHSPECLKQAAWILSTIHINENPCDNFYIFVCNPNTWTSDALVPIGSLSNRSNILETNFRSLNPLVSKIRKFYNACMNSEDFERYYEEYLNALKSWGLLKTYTNFDWTLFLYKARKHGLKHNMLFDFDVVYQNDSAILMIKPPTIREIIEPLEEFNMTFGAKSGNFSETLKRIADTGKKVIRTISIEELEKKYSVPSRETLSQITGRNFSKSDFIQLQTPSYFKQLNILLKNNTLDTILQDYLEHEMVRAIVDEYYAAPLLEDDRVDFCLSRVTNRVPFTMDLEYETEVNEIRIMAGNIADQLSVVLEDKEWAKETDIYRYERVNVVTAHDLLYNYKNYPALETYIESKEDVNYFQMLSDATIYKEDCYYSILDGEEADLSCLLYNSESINIYNDNTVITAKILEYSYYQKNAPEFLNYASVGTLIGRELIKSFLKFINSSNAFQSLRETEKCLLVQQLDYYYIPEGIAVPDVEEVLIDLAGTFLAYSAYRKLLFSGTSTTLPGLEYTPSQLFWLAKFREECHYSKTFSQISVLPFFNIDNFTSDFFCSRGTYMNPTTVPKCSIL